MHVLNMAHEVAAARDRANRTFTVSLLAHMVLFGWLLLHRQLDPAPEGLVEITWLEAAAPQPAPVPVQAPEPVVEPTPPVASEPAARPEKFERPEPEAEVKPAPQEMTVNRDKVRERLAKLQPSNVVGTAADAKLTVSASLLKSADAATPAPVQGKSQTELKRDPGVQSTPRTLTRGTEPRRRSVTAASVATPAPVDQQRKAADLDLENVSRRSLHGAELAGEIADRPVLSHALPEYPEWATTQAVEGKVTLYFEVLPDGRIKENVQVRKTAGFVDFDQNAITALRQWRFAPLPDGATVDQWGTITFRYRLRN